MLNSIPKYPGYTLMEILVVLSILIILGGLGTASFGGLRDTVLVNQTISEIKADIQDVQRASMLLQKGQNEGWIYGIGVDFSKLSEDGTYSFFKWCSPYAMFGSTETKSELLDYNFSEGIVIEGNGYLPIEEEYSDECNGTKSVLSKLQGYENKVMNSGFNLQTNDIQYILFESITGRAFLYYSNGQPAGYNLTNGEYTGIDGSANPVMLEISIDRNQGRSKDLIQVSPLSGNILKTEVNN